MALQQGDSVRLPVAAGDAPQRQEDRQVDQ